MRKGVSVVLLGILLAIGCASCDGRKLEFIAYGGVSCGGVAPVPGCVYTLEEWVGSAGSIEPGSEIKILIMNANSRDTVDDESCAGYEIDGEAYGNTATPVRVRARGRPCDWDPSYLFCVCEGGDFVRVEPNQP